MIDYLAVYDAAAQHIDSSYGLKVRRSDLPKGVTGDLNGLELVVDTDLEPPVALYVLLHIFGHTAQWANSRELHDLGHERPRNADEAKLAQILAYEKNASRIGVSLLNEIGHPELQEWISRFFWADWAFLSHLYATGEKIPIVIKDGPVELLDPLEIPSFKPTLFENRQAFD